jgi:hypothetical protein
VTQHGFWLIVLATGALTACGGPLLVTPEPTPSASPPTAPPAVLPVGPMTTSDVEATVLTLSPSHWLVLDSPGGVLVVVVGPGCDQALAPGSRVRLRSGIQQLTVVRGAPAPSPSPALPVARAPTMYSNMIGLVEAQAADGRITISAPGGAIAVLAGNHRWPTGTPVQVWTWVEPPVDCLGTREALGPSGGHQSRRAALGMAEGTRALEEDPGVRDAR